MKPFVHVQQRYCLSRRNNPSRHGLQAVWNKGCTTFLVTYASQSAASVPELRTTRVDGMVEEHEEVLVAVEQCAFLQEMVDAI